MPTQNPQQNNPQLLSNLLRHTLPPPPPTISKYTQAAPVSPVMARLYIAESSIGAIDLYPPIQPARLDE